jgi:pimeloyl-ACP methyl ester carboxylesterase
MGKPGGFDLRPRLSEIRVPALVIAGAGDRAVTAERAKELAEGLPMGDLLIIEKSGHYPFIEAPDEFLSGVREFLFGKPRKKGLFGRRSA